MTLTSDASGRCSCGAFSSSGDWLQFLVPSTGDNSHHCEGTAADCGGLCHVILCLCDNEAFVAIIKSGSKVAFLFTAFHQVLIVPRHFPGKDNTAADHLSWNALPSFLQVVPNAKPHPILLPVALIQALGIQRPDWTSQAWRAELGSTLHMDSPIHHGGHTSQERTAT